MLNRISSLIHPFEKKAKLVPSLIRLNHLALKKIFDGLTYKEEKELEQGIDIWPRKIIPKLDPLIQGLAKQELKVIINALIENKDGKFDRDKENFKRCEIDYRKAYPEGL